MLFKIQRDLVSGFCLCVWWSKKMCGMDWGDVFLVWPEHSWLENKCTQAIRTVLI